MDSPAPRKRRRWILKALLQAEKIYDAFHRFLARITGRLGKPMAAEIYYAVRHPDAVSVKGRVLLARKWRHPHIDDHPLVNFFQILLRWATPERPYSLVRVSAGGAAVEKRADREGYFEIDLAGAEVHRDEVYIELPESENSSPSHWEITGPGPAAKRLIISDVDDTVLVTHVARLLRMLATTFFGNALTRQLFPGTVALFDSLRKGPDPAADEGNAIAYVTSSPFNLHALLYLIFKENGLPPGAFFMTDWGLDEDRWLTRSHRDHKLDAIRQVLSWYPGTPAILIGDSGQYDTSIYIETALEHPGVIEQILIRNVSNEDRIDLLRSEVAKLENSGTRFAFFKDSAEAAAILADRGWISPEQSNEVSRIVHEPHPSLIDIVTNRPAGDGSHRPDSSP
jgi:phosphatidate phosphatase APP1